MEKTKFLEEISNMNRSQINDFLKNKNHKKKFIEPVCFLRSTKDNPALKEKVKEN